MAELTSRLKEHSKQSGVQLSLGIVSSSICEVVPPREARGTIIANHYTHSFPSRWSRTYRVSDALITFAYSANPYLENYLFTEKIGLLELARLYAPNEHKPNLLTHAIKIALSQLRQDVPGCQAVVSFADPSRGHHGGVYQAASWLYTGTSINPSGYQDSDGHIHARRSFHDGSGSYRPEGMKKVRLPAKFRYVRLLTRKSRRVLRVPLLPYPHSTPA